MCRQSRTDHTSGLEQVERELAEWRRKHQAPSPIPERVWAQAAVLATHQGVGPVARTLRLNHSALKRRMGASPPAEPTTTFIELLPPAVTAIGECSVEVESQRGSRMRIVMKNVPPSCMVDLLKDFAG